MPPRQRSKAQNNMLRLLAFYDEEIAYTTESYNEIRTLKALVEQGLIVADEYIDEPGRWFAWKIEKTP